MPGPGFAARGVSRPASELVRLLDKGPAGLVELADELAGLSVVHGRRPDVLVVVDQAEELLTLAGRQEQEAVLDLLSGALGPTSPVSILATLRSEFLTSRPKRAGLSEVVDDTVVIEPLSRDRLADVIAKPARRAGLELSPGLVERMVDDATGGDALPLLAYTLQELSRRAQADGRISTETYTEIGGVVGALRRQADRVTDELGRRGHGRRVMRTLTRLATITEDGEPTRRRVRRSTLDAEELLIVDAFVDARLLISADDPDPIGDGDAGQPIAAGEPTVEVAHEALLRQWPPLRAAIEADRVRLRLRSELERSAADWQAGGRDEAYLLRGGRLAVHDDHVDDPAGQMEPVEQEFLQASRESATRELQATRRSNRRLRLLAAGLASLVLLTTIAGSLAWWQGQRAQAQSRLAWSRQLATQADRYVALQPDVAILLGLQSMSLARDQNPTPPPALISGLADVTHASRELRTPVPAQQKNVVFSPRGNLLATASTERTVQVWDPATGQPRARP